VEDLAVFPAAGWALAPGDQAFRYTGRSASSGVGMLTGIPTSGVGALTADVRAGTVRAVAHLTGCSGIGVAIKRGDQVNVLVQRDDTAAQTALAALVGGDGIHEAFLSDGRLSQAECDARGDAMLAMNADPIASVTFDTRDQAQNVGWSLTINTTHPAVNTTLTIQSVTFSELGASGPRGLVFPKRTVMASSKRWSFEDLLRQIKESR
jgi:hypothetical protein